MAAENRRRNEAAVARLRLKAGERVLELGCGPGMGLRAAARVPGVLAAGVDASRDMARMAASHARGSAVVQARAERLPFPAGAFQAVFAVRAVATWRDPVAALAEAFRVLAPGGRILVAEKAGRDVSGWEARADDVETLLEDAGFAGVLAEYGAGHRPLLIAWGWKPGTASWG